MIYLKDARVNGYTSFIKNVINRWLKLIDMLTALLNEARRRMVLTCSSLIPVIGFVSCYLKILIVRITVMGHASVKSKPNTTKMHLKILSKKFRPTNWMSIFLTDFLVSATFPQSMPIISNPFHPSHFRRNLLWVWIERVDSWDYGEWYLVSSGPNTPTKLHHAIYSVRPHSRLLCKSLRSVIISVWHHGIRRKWNGVQHNYFYYLQYLKD